MVTLNFSLSDSGHQGRILIHVTILCVGSHWSAGKLAVEQEMALMGEMEGGLKEEPRWFEHSSDEDPIAGSPGRTAVVLSHHSHYNLKP